MRKSCQRNPIEFCLSVLCLVCLVTISFILKFNFPPVSGNLPFPFLCVFHLSDCFHLLLSVTPYCVSTYLPSHACLSSLPFQRTSFYSMSSLSVKSGVWFTLMLCASFFFCFFLKFCLLALLSSRTF